VDAAELRGDAVCYRADVPDRRSPAAAVPWGIFCACSWTWCVGMYLPILMLERYGWPGFLAFAVPNVLGCTAFGYVVRTRARSEAIVRRHAAAIRWFSSITSAYHVFFVAYLMLEVAPVDTPMGVALLVPVLLVAAGAALIRLPDRAWLTLAIAVFAVSLAALTVLVPEHDGSWPSTGESPPRDLLFLAPVLAFGFLLCPYLDPTFHRALQRAPGPHAFAVFGITFTLMIVLTTLYWARPGVRMLPLVVAHLALQSVFTVGAHARELRRSLPSARHALPWIIIPLLAVTPALMAVAAPHAGTGRDWYVRFLVFYGLAFPAYVAVFVRSGTPARRQLALLAAAVLVAAPLNELGFLHDRAWLLPIPVIVFLAWGLLGAPRKTSELQEP
jgi:hypothetical protein